RAARWYAAFTSRSDANLDPNGRPVALAVVGVPPDLVGRQALVDARVVDREMPGNLSPTRIGALLIFSVRGRVGTLVGIVGVVDRDSSEHELRARSVRVSNRDEILDDVQLRIGFVDLHVRLQ